MNQNIMLVALLLGALFFLRRPNARQQQLLQPSNARQQQLLQPSDFSFTGGEGTGYGIDIWGGEG
jgi:hypothetical protein